MIQNNMQREEATIRQMMQSAKRQAPENLQHRIMQQIETERALTRRGVSTQKSRSNSVLKDLVSIFGIMYAVLGAVIGGAFLWKGKEFLQSEAFVWTIVLIVFVFSLLWLITQLDGYLQRKGKKNFNK